VAQGRMVGKTLDAYPMYTHVDVRFKLHLCPQNMRPSDIAENDLKPLPPGKTVVDIYADILKYLFECAQTYIRERHPNGDNLWNSLVRHAEIILSHPNGWDGAPQASMRRAAVAAGLVDQTTEGESRVHFVTEGEASLHFCISRAMAADGIMVRLSRSSTCASFSKHHIFRKAKASLSSMLAEGLWISVHISGGRTSLPSRRLLLNCVSRDVHRLERLNEQLHSSSPRVSAHHTPRRTLL
jgi:hypothetical protein